MAGIITEADGVYNLPYGELQRLLNTSKELSFRALQTDGVVDDADVLSQRYAVVLIGKGWFGKVIDRIFCRSRSDNYTIVVVRTIDDFEGGSG